MHLASFAANDHRAYIFVARAPQQMDPFYKNAVGMAVGANAALDAVTSAARVAGGEVPFSDLIVKSAQGMTAIGVVREVLNPQMDDPRAGVSVAVLTMVKFVKQHYAPRDTIMKHTFTFTVDNAVRHLVIFQGDTAVVHRDHIRADFADARYIPVNLIHTSTCHLQTGDYWCGNRIMDVNTLKRLPGQAATHAIQIATKDAAGAFSAFVPLTGKLRVCAYPNDITTAPNLDTANANEVDVKPNVNALGDTIISSTILRACLMCCGEAKHSLALTSAYSVWFGQIWTGKIPYEWFGAAVLQLPRMVDDFTPNQAKAFTMSGATLVHLVQIYRLSDLDKTPAAMMVAEACALLVAFLLQTMAEGDRKEVQAAVFPVAYAGISVLLTYLFTTRKWFEQRGVPFRLRQGLAITALIPWVVAGYPGGELPHYLWETYIRNPRKEMTDAFEHLILPAMT